MQFSPSPVVRLPLTGCRTAHCQLWRGPRDLSPHPPFSFPFPSIPTNRPTRPVGARGQQEPQPPSPTGRYVPCGQRRRRIALLEAFRSGIRGRRVFLESTPPWPIVRCFVPLLAFRSCVAHMSHLVVGAFLPLASSMRTVPSGAPKISSPRSPLWGYSQGVVGSSCIITNPCRHSWF